MRDIVARGYYNEPPAGDHFDTYHLSPILNVERSTCRFAARIPIIESMYVHKEVKKLIEWWNRSGKKSKSRLSSSFQHKLDEQFDIARKPRGRYNEEKTNAFLNHLMRTEGLAAPRSRLNRHAILPRSEGSTPDADGCC